MNKKLIILPKNYQNKAFTVIEISVVLIVIAILFIQTLSTTKITSNIKNRIARDRSTVIYKTMGAFLAEKKDCHVQLQFYLIKIMSIMVKKSVTLTPQIV